MLASCTLPDSSAGAKAPKGVAAQTVSRGDAGRPHPPTRHRRRTMFGPLLGRGLEPRARRARHDLVVVLDEVLRALELRLGAAQLAAAAMHDARSVFRCLSSAGATPSSALAAPPRTCFSEYSSSKICLIRGSICSMILRYLSITSVASTRRRTLSRACLSARRKPLRSPSPTIVTALGAPPPRQRQGPARGEPLPGHRAHPRGARQHAPASAARTGGTADAVQVRLEVGRHVHVDDRLDAGNVQAARSNIGRHQVVRPPVAELVERFQTLCSSTRAVG